MPPASGTSKSQRLLACVLCSQRKVKCDRKSPCGNCIKSRAQCVPATLAPRRRKCKPLNKEMLERLHQYEDLLRQNNIKFEPFHGDAAFEKRSPSVPDSRGSEDEQPEADEAECSSPSVNSKSEAIYKAKNIWHNMSQGSKVVNEVAVKQAWDESFEQNDFLLLGSRKTAVELSTIHPEPVQMFRLWQIYLENVNPLVKVIHATSLQGRIIEAASNVQNINPSLEALMFSIYSMSVLSLTVDDCQSKFGSSKEYLLTRYQFGCQQALLNSGFLRTADRDCLTALYLYLVSIGNRTDPQSLSSMLGIAFRIAQRMGIHSESDSAKHTPLEAEMRRRLWWGLILFDTRIGELADYKNTTLALTWDCKIPLNVNDSDLRPEMKESPAAQKTPTEALFAVVCSELGSFVRHTKFHLNFTKAALNPVAKLVQHGTTSEGSKLTVLEKIIEDKYLKLCDPENPLHFMTIWTSRAYLAKCRLMEHQSENCSASTSSVHQTEPHRNAAISLSLNWLECDTKIMSSPLTKGYLWLTYFYFPFPAYIHTIQDIIRQPVSKHTEQAWEVMSDNYEARFGSMSQNFPPLFNIFSKVILQGWDAREAALRRLGEPVSLPRIVSSIKHKLAQSVQNTQSANTKEWPKGSTDINIESFLVSMPMSFGANSLLYGSEMEGQSGYVGAGPGLYPDMPVQTPSNVDMNQVDWATMDWNLSERRG